jgi:hypothetical protein
MYSILFYAFLKHITFYDSERNKVNNLRTISSHENLLGYPENGGCSFLQNDNTKLQDESLRKTIILII